MIYDRRTAHQNKHTHPCAARTLSPTAGVSNHSVRSYSAAPVLLAETQARLMAKLEAIPAHSRQGYATSTVAGTPDEVCSYYQALVKAGVRYFIVGLYGNDLETMCLLARQVVPQLSTGQVLSENTV